MDVPKYIFEVMYFLLLEVIKFFFVFEEQSIYEEFVI